jgi:anthranilate phosphoribosyltransferase
VDNAEQSLAVINSVFENQVGPALDIVKLNAGAAIYAAGLTSSLAEGVESAAEAISTGKAKQTFESLIRISNSL